MPDYMILLFTYTYSDRAILSEKVQKLEAKVRIMVRYIIIPFMQWLLTTFIQD